MKHYLVRCSLILLLFLMIGIRPADAAESYSDLYIAISDAILNSKQGNEGAAIDALHSFQEEWKETHFTKQAAAKQIDIVLAETLQAKSAEQRLEKLTKLSKALHTLEKAENPVDELAERQTFAKAIQPSLDGLEQTLKTDDLDRIRQANRAFLATWTKNERVVREQSIATYGKIETQMAFMRISLEADEPDLNGLQEQFNTLSNAIQDFIKGNEAASAAEGYSLATLLDLLDESMTQIHSKEYSEAAETLREFITVWPNVEGEIRSKNAGLYTKIENDIPLLVSALSKENVNQESIENALADFKQQIALLQGDRSYSVWDAALILLREGLEALLIILALVAFLKKSGQEKMQKWIYTGAIVGILFSAAAAFFMSTLFQSVTIGTSREMMEGIIGLLAAVMMIGVGIWLHNKSSITSWNRYISRQMGHAISKQSVFAMAFISFLSVFREGAETIVFYAGIAPKMSVASLSLGIVAALAILAVVAFIFLRASGKIPIHRFFAVATLFIYALAFKIIGVSLHTLQLTHVLPLSALKGLPIINTIGFYPTIETMIGQAVLLLFIVGAVVYSKKAAAAS